MNKDRNYMKNIIKSSYIIEPTYIYDVLIFLGLIIITVGIFTLSWFRTNGGLIMFLVGLLWKNNKEAKK